MEQNKLNDIKVASLEGNVGMVAALGKEHRADLVIIGYADASLEKSADLPQGLVHFYIGSMAIKVVRTDDAQIIHSKSFPLGASETGRRYDDKITANSGSKVEAQNRTLVAVSKYAAPKIIIGIMKAWNEDITLGSEVTVTIQGVTFRDVRSILKKLKAIRFVTEVNQDSFSNRIVKFRVKTRYDSFKLAEKLIDEEICGDYQITDVQKNSIGIDLTLKDE
jgi:hypothetical protein